MINLQVPPKLEFHDKMGIRLSNKEASLKMINRFFAALEDLELFILRLAGFLPIFTLRWLIYKSAGLDLSRSTHLHMGTQFFKPNNISIGEGTIIGQNAFLDGRDRLVIGNHVDIASDVLIYTSEHDIHSVDFHPIYGKVLIEDYCFIGPRVIILPGVRIGRGAVVAAGAVVTKDVLSLKVVAGVPAKEIGDRKIKDLHYRLGGARLFQ